MVCLTLDLGFLELEAMMLHFGVREHCRCLPTRLEAS